MTKVRTPLLDALAVLAVAREAALAADALAGRVRRGEATATDGRGARNDAVVWTCTDVSRVSSAGWGEHTDHSHSAAVAVERSEH